MEITNIAAGLIMLGFAFLCSCLAYANGYKTGKQEGYARGHSVARHASSKVVTK